MILPQSIIVGILWYDEVLKSIFWSLLSLDYILSTAIESKPYQEHFEIWIY
jgi:hypothetical protein